MHASDLANHFDVTVWSLDEIEDLADADFEELAGPNGDCWSAFTLKLEDNHLVVFNPNASEPRINSVVMHELSHIILGHKLSSGGLTEDGHFIPDTYNQDEESEADWLAGTLLLPRPALLYVRRQGLPKDAIRKQYLVSTQMLDWRIRMTGVDYQLANAGRRRR